MYPVRLLTLRLMLLITVMALPACQTFKPPVVDTLRFVPMPVQQRVMDEPRVKYLARADGHDYCARITGLPVTPTSRPMACAFWNVRRQQCTIVTPIETGYNYLGHELRHCFEGAFHD